MCEGMGDPWIYVSEELTYRVSAEVEYRDAPASNKNATFKLLFQQYRQ